MESSVKECVWRRVVSSGMSIRGTWGIGCYSRQLDDYTRRAYATISDEVLVN